MDKLAAKIYLTFTIQNVPIKWNPWSKKRTGCNDLQYKMFLLNITFAYGNNQEMQNLQYKMFLLNTTCVATLATVPLFTIQNVPIKSGKI